MSFELGQALDNICKHSFQIMDIYKKLIELEKNRNKDNDYHSKKKALLEQLGYYKSLEDDEYSFFNGQIIELIDAIMLFKDEITPSYINTVNRKIEDLIKQRIIDRLQNLMINDVDFVNHSGDFDIKFKNFVAFHKADYELEEISNSDVEARKNIFIENFYYEAFMNSELENCLIKRNFSSVPHNLNEEICALKAATNQEELSQSVIDEMILNIILGALLNELLFSKPSIKTTELLMTFKILILYLSENALKILTSLLNTMQFQDITVKLKIMHILASNDKEKNKQNSDLNIMFN